MFHLSHAASRAGLVIFGLSLAWGCSTPEEEMSPAEWISENSTVLDQLRSYDDLERRKGVSRIKQLGKERGLGLCLFILGDPKLDDYRVEVVLARLVAEWRDPRAIPYLLENLQVPDDGAVRIASEGLVSFGSNPRVIDALSEMLQKSASTRDRLTAAMVFTRIRNPETTQLLGECIKEELDPEVRAQLVVGVVGGQHPRRREFLVDALVDRDLEIRRTAWAALKQYRDLPKVEYAPDADDATRARGVGALRIWVKEKGVKP
jgi:HEAT repeat protein